MNKRAILIHGWGGSPNSGWNPWLRRELRKRDFEVSVPRLPDTNHPKMNAWLRQLTKTVGKPDKNCYLVGHSLGCITILRYLETLKKNQKIGGVVLVAGFVSDLGYEEIEHFYVRPINWKKVKSHCKRFVAIHSDNDKYVSLHYAEIFKEKLNAKIIIRHDMGHFSGGEGVMKLPIVLDSILKLSR